MDFDWSARQLKGHHSSVLFWNIRKSSRCFYNTLFFFAYSIIIIIFIFLLLLRRWSTIRQRSTIIYLIIIVYYIFGLFLTNWVDRNSFAFNDKINEKTKISKQIGNQRDDYYYYFVFRIFLFATAVCWVLLTSSATIAATTMPKKFPTANNERTKTPYRKCKFRLATHSMYLWYLQEAMNLFGVRTVCINDG